MKSILMILLLALQASDCDTQAAKPAPSAPESGREAMTLHGKRVGKLEAQTDGTYLLRYSNGEVDRVSANEVVLMPEPKLPQRPEVK